MSKAVTALAALALFAIAAKKRTPQPSDPRPLGYFKDDSDDDDDDDSSLPKPEQLRATLQCAWCSRKAIAYLIRGQQWTSLRMPANWSLTLPCSEVLDEHQPVHCHCPWHGVKKDNTLPMIGGQPYIFPITPNYDGPKRDGTWHIPEGWFWGWVKPSETAAYDAFQQKNADIFKVRKTWGNASLGSAFLFEVLPSRKEDDLRWTLPGVPRRAPNGIETNLAELTLGAARRDVTDEFVAFVEWLSGQPWELLRNEWARLKKPPEQLDPLPWPWAR